MDILYKIGQFFYAFKPSFTSWYGIWGSIVTFLFFYKTIYSIIGALCTRKFAPAKNFHKYAIVIAARNEEAVIGNLLDSINKQDYPMDKITVFVVADNCFEDDKTAEIARSKGAIVYERHDDKYKTKGYALQFLFENIEKDYGTQNFEGFFVFDADNLLKSDYISRMNDAFDSGERIITSFRNSKNFDENWIASNYALHWLRSSRQLHRARSVFRLATNIQGTGFLFASELVKNGWKYTSLTEDRAFTADAVVQGYQITYNDAAEFYDEQPTSFKIAIRQRVRWAKGHIMAFVESGWGLFKNIFIYKGKNFWDTLRQRFACFDVFLLVFPRPLFTALKMLMLTTVYILSYTISPYFWLWTGIFVYQYVQKRIYAWINNMRVAVYIFIFDHKRIKKISLWDKIKFTVMWPMFDIIGKYAMYAALFMKVTWKPIPHNSKVTIDDVTKTKSTVLPKFLQKSGESATVRFVCHCAFAAVAFTYSLFMLNISTSACLAFLLGNIVLIALHAVCELFPRLPKVFSFVLLCLTFILNVTLCCEVMGNGAISYAFSVKLLINMMLYAIPFIILYMLTGSLKASTISTTVFWFLAASANFFLVEMRGRPLFLSDLFSIGTAINVMGNYEFSITSFFVITLLYLAVFNLYVGVLESRHEKNYFKYKWFVRYTVNITLIVVICLMVSSSTFLTSVGVTPYFWSHKVNGFPLNFVIDLQHSAMEKPNGYSANKVAQLYNDYTTGTVNVNTASSTSRPNVIVIMNESFSDLRIINDFETNIDVTPFIDTLYDDENVISGYSFVSVFGGGTANSEYEFLTGDNMFIYPQGAVPYQTNFKKVTHLPSIVESFNSLGYRTVATHPYYSSSWNRPVVYTAMGFDEQQYIEDYTSAKFYRAYVSDKSDFDNIISLYEMGGDDPLFVFNVTMQNHGGYRTKYKNFNQQVKLMNTKSKYPLAEQYLSLLHETDSAVEELINYFNEVDDPTLIIFFGDHQVQIEDEFYEELYGKPLSALTEEEMLLKYATRFFVWANYDLNMPVDYQQMLDLEQLIPALKRNNADDEANSENNAATSSGTAMPESGTASSNTAIPESSNTSSDSATLPESGIASSGTAMPESGSTSSDSATPTQPESVLQKRSSSPQLVTNISYLSSIAFDAAGIPTSPYQRFLNDLRKEYPVVTAFGVIDSTGTYHSSSGQNSYIKGNMQLYEYAIYNRVFDKQHRFDKLFSLSPSDIAFYDGTMENIFEWINSQLSATFDSIHKD